VFDPDPLTHQVAPGAVCPVCNWKYDARKTLKVRVWDFVLRTRNWVGNAFVWEDLLWSKRRTVDPDTISDTYDGTLFEEHSLRHGADPQACWAWRQVNDPCELTQDGKSWTPVLFECLTRPWWNRSQRGAMHLGLLLPPGIKNLSLVAPYFLRLIKGQVHALWCTVCVYR
jgi:hypothetical protein